MSTKRHTPSEPVSSKEDLKDFLIAGLESGEPQRLTEQDWEELRQRAARTAEAARQYA